MYFDSRKQWQSAFVHSNIKIQMRKLHRRIFMQQATLTSDSGECNANEGQERIKRLLLQTEIKRFLKIDFRFEMMIERVNKRLSLLLLISVAL